MRALYNRYRSGNIAAGSGTNIPAIIKDGNTVAWYDTKDLSTITKDVNNMVSRLNDKLLSGHDVLQADTSKQPVYNSAGIEFQITQSMKASFTYNQPEFIYLVFKTVSWLNNYQAMDGYTAGKGLLQMNALEGYYRAYAGTGSTNMPVSRSGKQGVTGITIIARILFNGASSKIQFNGGPVTTGNFGANNMGGITLGFGNVIYKESILRKIADNSTSELDIYNYLKKKHKTKTILMFGDSTMSYYDPASVIGISHYMTQDFLVSDEAFIGATVAQMDTALTNNTSTDVDCVYVMIGLNNLGSGSAVLIAAYQSFINNIRTKYPKTKIFVATMIPCNRSGQEAWTGLNQAILGLGSTPITGVDGRIDTVNTALNNGSNELSPIYDTGDHLHENNAGRQLLAGLFDAKRQEFGL